MTGRALGRRVAFAVWLAVASGCGGGSGEDGGSTPADRSGSPARESADAPATDPGVAVFLTEYMIDMPLVLDAGEVRISVTNEGVEDHNLRLLKAGTDEIVWQTEENVGSGATVEAVFDLPAGRYLAVCDFAGHDSRGMFLEIEARDP